MYELLGLGLVGLVGLEGLRGPEERGPSWGLVAWTGGLGVTVGGLDLGAGSGLDSSASAGATGGTSDLAAGKKKKVRSQNNTLLFWKSYYFLMTPLKFNYCKLNHTL